MVGFFDNAYRDGGVPTWDVGRPQGAIVRAAAGGLIVGAVLDAGCGTGENALHLAALGHPVVGVDFAAAAIERARAKAAERGLPAEFLVADALDLAALDRTFDTAIDVGLFHTLGDAERPRYAASLAAAVRPGGRVVLLCWSDRNPFGRGPRQDLAQRRSAQRSATAGLWRRSIPSGWIRASRRAASTPGWHASPAPTSRADVRRARGSARAPAGGWVAAARLAGGWVAGGAASPRMPAMARLRQAGYARPVSHRVSQIGCRCSCRRRAPAQGARAICC